MERENIKPQTQDQKQIGSYRQTTKTKEQMLFKVTLFTLKGAASPKRRTLEQDQGAFKSNDDGDGIENGKKEQVQIGKITIHDVHYTFFYISLPSLHDYDVKMPI